MNLHIEHLKSIRQNLSRFLENYSVKAINHVPSHYKNNVFWNIAHCLVTQQLLHYYLSGNEMLIGEDWVAQFKKGTSAQENYSQKDIVELKHWLQSTVTKLEKDYESGLFSTYQKYPTSFGIEINSIEEAFAFNNLHESLHLGYCMALMKNL